MSDEPEKEATPKVFISYSHDSPEHKKWVGEFATKLMDHGVDVILDQWDLGLGDDVPKFMEKAVSEADRVLMICSETYVRKADDGKGGVGYEAMIVTGELVRDLGTAKFIPVVRQGGGTSVLPKCVSTRFYVNFSEGQNEDEQFETLVRELHKAPKLPKPPLGKNPFAGGKGTTLPVGQTKPEGVVIGDAAAMFQLGSELARRDDLLGWRKAVGQARDTHAKALIAWRQNFDAFHSVDRAKLPDIMTEAAAVYSPLMSLAIAGVVSGNRKFGNQASILDELREPKDWNPGGLVVLTQIPAGLVFTFQAIHGAACLFTGQLAAAIELSRARLSHYNTGEVEPLCEQSALIGWPESLGGDCTVAWRYLTGLFERLPWLQEIFGTASDYRASLCGYYLALHVQELAILIQRNATAELDRDRRYPEVPLIAAGIAEDERVRAYRMLMQDPAAVKAIWEIRGVTHMQMSTHWERWLYHAKKLVGLDRHRTYRGELPHAHLLDDVPSS